LSVAKRKIVVVERNSCPWLQFDARESGFYGGRGNAAPRA
jgi:hypothetical protein